MDTDWGWDPKIIEDIIKQPKTKYKYVITDSKEEFMASMQRIADASFKQTGDNLRYLEQLDRIKLVKAGADIYDVYTWLKECNSL